MTDTVLYEADARGVVVLRLNRPAARNAFNLAMAESLATACRRAAAEDARLVLLRAEGPVFCAGADLKERQGMTDDQVRARRLKGFAAYAAIEALPMPVVAVVEGPAVGSGCEMAAACDFVVATPAASFRTPEALWGTVGATQRLPRVLGKRLAKDMMLTGRVLTAEEALAHGLVTRLVAPEALEAVLEEIAATVAQAPPAALRLAKRCIDEGVERDPHGALATELLAIEESLAAAEWRAAMARF
ncbi:enoyl-CoA hydratase/isomerase family protein [Paracraurococcus lichenis]|uniref:Enoyl-CoA hydratase/isomerase family protein n=1 Tax=Paracraurococcus lichenis TaxID=3064888 RepID=A0ABT9E005_9PROT|nr:enoyl-CoA hydratase/isomerase family protein [Paracraurococcus sp. LOR1-02]MDO9709496.1 enoyl-CoA hydratase/isomerase family protein [Paracraurococcus sp. LOR1-02]